MPRKKVKQEVSWNAALIKAASGEIFVVGRPAIERDYASMCMELDGVSLGFAMEKARDLGNNDIKTWFCEQWGLEMVKEEGVCLAMLTYQQMLHGVPQETQIRSCEIEFIKL